MVTGRLHNPPIDIARVLATIECNSWPSTQIVSSVQCFLACEASGLLEWDLRARNVPARLSTCNMWEWKWWHHTRYADWTECTRTNRAENHVRLKTLYPTPKITGQNMWHKRKESKWMTVSSASVVCIEFDWAARTISWAENYTGLLKDSAYWTYLKVSSLVIDQEIDCPVPAGWHTSLFHIQQLYIRPCPTLVNLSLIPCWVVSHQNWNMNSQILQHNTTPHAAPLHLHESIVCTI